MNIAIVAPSAVPFLVGGAEKFWWGLLHGLNQFTPHHADLIKLPSPERDFWELMESYRRFSEIDVSGFDLVISTKYPAWMVPHPNQVCYLQHRLRGLYDTYHLTGLPTALPPLPRRLHRLGELLQGTRADRAELPPLFAELDAARADPELARHFPFPGPLTRAVVHVLDGIGLAPGAVRRYLAISRTVAERADYFPPGVQVDVLHHPSDLPSAQCTGYRHIFTASRLDAPKRLDLLIDAFRRIDTDIELRIAGTGPVEAQLRQRAEGDRRICFLGHVSDAQVIAEYGAALFVPFIPYDEDYGLITLEAMRAGKAVLTTTDAGGVNELVDDGQTGLSVSPEPASLARAMRRLIDDPAATRAMGEAARERIVDINWPRTVERLLRPPAVRMQAQRRPKLVIAVDFPIYPPRGGGQARVFQLYRALARRADCVLVTLCDAPAAAGRFELAPGLIELRLPKSEAHRSAAHRLDAELGASAGDVATLMYQHLTPDYAETLAREAADCALLVCSHPYVYPSLAQLDVPRLWYEAHNVEADMKRAVLGASAAAAPYLERVASTEQALCMRAERIMVCADADAKRLGELYDIDRSRCMSVPNGVDTRAVSTVTPAQHSAARAALALAARHAALFVGSWHQPNIEAVARLHEVARACPELDLLVAGSVCRHPIMVARPANLYPLGELTETELSVLLQAADLALNPVVSGSGTNLKMLHYAAAGIPMLTTPFGNRGLRFRADEHLWCAELADFPLAINELLHSPAECRRARVSAARRLAETHYDWRVIADLIPLPEAGLHQAR